MRAFVCETRVLLKNKVLFCWIFHTLSLAAYGGVDSCVEVYRRAFIHEMLPTADSGLYSLESLFETHLEEIKRRVRLRDTPVSESLPLAEDMDLVKNAGLPSAEDMDLVKNAEMIRAHFAEMDNLILDHIFDEDRSEYLRKAKTLGLTIKEANVAMDWFLGKVISSEKSSPGPGQPTATDGTRLVPASVAQLVQQTQAQARLARHGEVLKKIEDEPYFRTLRVVRPQRPHTGLEILWNELTRLRQASPEISETALAREITKFAHDRKLIPPLDYISENEVMRRAPRFSSSPEKILPRLRRGESIGDLFVYEKSRRISAHDVLVRLFKEGHSMPEIVQRLNAALGFKNTEQSEYRDESVIKAYIRSNQRRFDMAWVDRMNNIEGMHETRSAQNPELSTQKVEVGTESPVYANDRSVAKAELALKQKEIRLLEFDIIRNLSVSEFHAFLKNPNDKIPNFSTFYPDQKGYFKELLTAHPNILVKWSLENPEARKASREWVLEGAVAYAKKKGLNNPKTIEVLNDSQKLLQALGVTVPVSLYHRDGFYKVFDSKQEFDRRLKDALEDL